MREEYKQEDFYTVKLEKKQVSGEEFIKFLENYPRKLVRDVFGAFEPPLISYNDFELANRWPYSVVASTLLYSDIPDDYYYVPEEERKYYIATNFQEAFDSKTGFKA